MLYLSMCYFGPKLMATRQAFDPKGFMLVYNAYQTLFNIGTVVGPGGYSGGCILL